MVRTKLVDVYAMHPKDMAAALMNMAASLSVAMQMAMVARDDYERGGHPVGIVYWSQVMDQIDDEVTSEELPFCSRCMRRVDKCFLSEFVEPGTNVKMYKCLDLNCHK